MPYTHRNGEKIPPTETGVYRFFGRKDGLHLGVKDVELFVTDEMPGELCVEWGSIYNGLSVFEGRWWGPVRSLQEEHRRQYEALMKKWR